VLTKELLLAKIPRHSNGRFKCPPLQEIWRLLSSYKYNEMELKILAGEIQEYVEKFGHEGPFVLKSKRRQHDPVMHYTGK
jgi:hypothetical protein